MKKLLVILTLFGAFMLMVNASNVLAVGQYKSIPWEATGPFKHVDDSGLQRTKTQQAMHKLNLIRMASMPAGLPVAVSEDVGDIAVIVDNGSIFSPPKPQNLLDLPTPSALSFVPGVDSFDVSFSSTSLDAEYGIDLGLSDDDTTEVAFPAGFPFLGANYTTVWVNSDGNITLGEGDDSFASRSAIRHISGPPRLSTLLTDLNPDCRGTVFADVRSDRIVVTWDQVVHYERGSLEGCGVDVPTTTIQAVLYTDGKVEFIYVEFDSGMIAQDGFNREAVIGVAEGNSAEPFNAVDLTEDLPGTFGAGAIYEEFHPSIPELYDDIQLAREFYRTHEDVYDFLVVFTEEPVELGGAFAYEFNIKNETQGLGLLDTFDFSALLGSEGELESQLFMNNINLYWPDSAKLVNPPIKKFRFSSPPGATLDGPPGSDQISRRARRMGTLQGDFGFYGSYTLGLNSAMSIMAQETGHRWLAFTTFVHPETGFGPDSFDLLGRQQAHWSFFLNVSVPENQFGGDPRASSMEGNAILDLGPEASADLPMPCDASLGESTFLTQRDELIDGYTELDQYFMGLRPASEVSPFWYVDEPRSAFSGNSLAGISVVAAQDDIIFCGKRVDLMLSDITDAGAYIPSNGPRLPAIGDEVDQDANGNPVDDVKTMAFILLLKEGPPRSPAHASAIQRVDIFRQTWEDYANGLATGGLGRFDTSLDPIIH